MFFKILIFFVILTTDAFSQMSEVIPTIQYLHNDHFKNRSFDYNMQKKSLISLQQWRQANDVLGGILHIQKIPQKSLRQKLSIVEIPDDVLKHIILHTVDVEKLVTAGTLPDLYESIGPLYQLSRVNKKFKGITDTVKNSTLQQLKPFNDRIGTLLTLYELNGTLKNIFLETSESIYAYVKRALWPGGISDTKQVLKGYEHLTADTFIRTCRCFYSGVLFCKGMRNVDDVDDRGDTVLLYSCKRFPYVPPIEFLLENGADANVANSLSGGTPLMSIVSGGIPHRYGIPENEISAGIAAAIKMATLLLERGADINAQDNKGKTALMIACIRAGYIKTSEWNYQTVDFPKLVDNSAMIKFLLDRGANPNLQDKLGRTALRWAVESSGDFQNHIELLLTHFADPNIKDVNENSALDILGYQGNNRIYGDPIAMKSILLDHGKTKHGPRTNKYII